MNFQIKKFGKKAFPTIAAISAAVSMLVGCGGGGSSTGSGGSGVQGVPPGTGNGSTALSVDGIYLTGSSSPSYTITYSVLPSGEYYGYVVQGISPFGLLHGTVTGSATSIQSNNLGFYNFQGANGGTLSNGGSLTANFSATSGNSFTATLAGTTVVTQASKQSQYSSTDSRLLYSQPLTLGQLAGTYAGSVYSVGASLGFATPFSGLALNSTGSFSVSLGNCQGNGVLTPAVSGKGIFTTTMSITGANCGLSGQSASGIATPTIANVDSTGKVTSAGMLLQLLSSNGNAAIVLSAGR